MRAIQKSIISDESQRPVAVQIGYADWLEIERFLNLPGEELKTANPSRFAGAISLAEDPLAYQLRVRGEWR